MLLPLQVTRVTFQLPIMSADKTLFTDVGGLLLELPHPVVETTTAEMTKMRILFCDIVVSLFTILYAK